MKTDKELSDTIVDVKQLIRECQVKLSNLIGSKEFENRKEFYQAKIIEAIKSLNSIRESL